MIGKEQIDTLVFPNLNYYSSMWMSWNFLVIFSQILFFMGRECYLRVSLPSPTLLCLLFILTAGKQNCTWYQEKKKKKRQYAARYLKGKRQIYVGLFWSPSKVIFLPCEIDHYLVSVPRFTLSHCLGPESSEARESVSGETRWDCISR